MLPYKEFTPKHICSFGITEFIIPAIVGFVADAAAAGGAALGLGAADVAAADVGAGVAAADIGAGAAAADVGAGVAAGDVFATGAAAVPFAGESAAGLGTGLGLGAGDVGAAAAGLGDAALTGAGAAATTAAVPFAGVGGVADVLAGGATGPLAALGGAGAASPIAGDFAALSEAGIGPSVDISGDVAAPIGGDISGGVTSIPETLGGDTSALSAFSPTDTTATFGQTFGAETDALSAVNQAAAGTGLTPANVSQAAYGFPAGETAGAPAAPSFAPTEASAAATAAPPPPTPTIEPTIGPGTTPGSPLNLATAAPADIGSTIGPGAPSDVSPSLASIFSGSNLRTAATLAPLGLLGYTLARGPQPLPPAEQQAVSNANVVGGFGATQLALGNQNQITPAQQAQIDTFTQQATDQAYQLYANQGGDPTKNTGFLRAVQNIQQQAITMRQQFVDAEINNGIQAMGVADQTLTGAANMQVANDNAFSNSIASATSALGFMAILGSKAA